MSTDTPTPERVTLSDAMLAGLHEAGWFARADIDPDHLYGLVHDATDAISGWLAAREQALREEIAKLRLELGEWIARYESLREAYDVAAEEWVSDYADWTANNPGPSGIPSDPPMLDTYIARGGAR